MRKYLCKVVDWTIQLLFHCMRSKNLIVKFIAYIIFFTINGFIVLTLVMIAASIYLVFAIHF